MSVSTGNPYSFLISASKRRPSFKPVPRPPIEVRLALSNEPLKTMFSSLCFFASFTNTSATVRHTVSFSSEQGPAMRRSLLGSKIIEFLLVRHPERSEGSKSEDRDSVAVKSWILRCAQDDDRGYFPFFLFL